jgi:hypothetical protein
MSPGIAVFAAGRRIPAAGQFRERGRRFAQYADFAAARRASYQIRRNLIRGALVSADY